MNMLETLLSPVTALIDAVDCVADLLPKAAMVIIPTVLMGAVGLGMLV